MNILLLKTIGGFLVDKFTSKNPKREPLEAGQTKPRFIWLKRISFVLLILPVVIMVFSPETTDNFFEDFKHLPDEYLYIMAAVLSVIWGVPKMMRRR